jgi:hypothetical protein
VITIASLSTLAILQAESVFEKNLTLFRNYAEYGNNTGVRIAAVKALISLGLNSEIQQKAGFRKTTVLEFILQMVSMDPPSSSLAKFKVRGQIEMRGEGRGGGEEERGREERGERREGRGREKLSQIFFFGN